MQTDFEVIIIWPQPSKCWDFGYVMARQAWLVFLVEVSLEVLGEESRATANGLD